MAKSSGIRWITRGGKRIPIGLNSSGKGKGKGKSYKAGSGQASLTAKSKLTKLKKEYNFKVNKTKSGREYVQVSKKGSNRHMGTLYNNTKQATFYSKGNPIKISGKDIISISKRK